MPRPTRVASAAASPGKPGGRFAVFTAALLLVIPAAPCLAQFSAQPVILEVRTGDSASVRTVSVRNESESPLQLRIYAGDFDQGADGVHQFLAPGSHPRSCVDRLEMYPDNLLLEPQQTGDVRVVMEPRDSTCWSMIFVQSVSRAQGGMQISQRIGIKVYGLSRLIVPAGEIRSVSVDADSATGALSAAIGFENLGDGPLRPEGELEIRTEEGEVVAVVPVAPFSILPGRTRTAVVPLPAGLPTGTYLVIPILDFGGDYLAGGQAVFDVPG